MRQKTLDEMIFYDMTRFLAAITFVENPGLLGVVYFPPIGDLTVVCSTQDSANITWVSSKGDIYKPGNAKLNITQATDRKSILYVSNNDDSAKGILLFGGPFRCQAQDPTTLQEITTDYFDFLMGSEYTQAFIVV